jgi:hypothetical protein
VRCSIPWTPTYGSSPTGGHYAGTTTSRNGGSSTTATAHSTLPGTTDGYSATATAAPTSSSSPGHGSSGTRWSKAEPHPTTPPWPTTATPGAAETHPRWARSTLRLFHAQHGCCPLCADYLLLADHLRASPTEWEQWLTVTRKAITKYAIITAENDKPDDHKLRLICAHCQQRHTSGPTTHQTCTHGHLSNLRRIIGVHVWITVFVLYNV